MMNQMRAWQDSGATDSSFNLTLHRSARQGQLVFNYLHEFLDSLVGPDAEGGHGVCQEKNSEVN